MQSAERRRYNEKRRLVSAQRHTASNGNTLPREDMHSADVTSDTSEWDEEAREAAWQQAQDLAEHDPDAADLLMAHLRAHDERYATDAAQTATATATPTYPVSAGGRAQVKPFDPARLLARVRMRYGGTHYDLLHTPWRTVLMYAREAEILSEEEEEAYKRMRARGGYGGSSQQEVIEDEAEVAQMLPPRPVIWDGTG